MRREISSIIKKWKEEAGVNGIVLVSAFSGFSDTITICTDRPGLMIGIGGHRVERYMEKLKEVNPNLMTINFVETDGWYIK